MQRPHGRRAHGCRIDPIERSRRGVRPRRGFRRLAPLTASRAAGVAWGIAGALACAAMSGLEPNVLEEGFPLHVAQRLVAGEALYRDVVFFTGPLPFEGLALLFRIFGESLGVARAAIVVLAGAATAATWGIARRAGSGPVAHVAAALAATTPVFLFPLYSLYFYTTIAALLSTPCVYCAVRGLESRRWALAAGALAACVVLSKQTVGAALAVGIVLALAAAAPRGGRLRASGSAVLGGASVALAAVLAFAARGTLGDLVESLIVLPRSLGTTFALPYPKLWPPGVLDEATRGSWPFYLPRLYVILARDPATIPPALAFGVQLLYASPFAALAATLLRGARGRLPPALWLHGVAVLAAATNLVPRSDWGHLAMALPATAVQLALVAGAPGAPAGARRDGAARLSALRVWVSAAGVAMLVGGAALAGARVHAASGPPTFGPRVPLRPVSEVYETPAVPRVIEYVRARTRPGEPIFVARQEPLLYFATDTTNPTRFGGMIHGLRELEEPEILAALPRVRFVVMSEIDHPFHGTYAEELPAVQAELERRWRVPFDFTVDASTWILVLEPGVDRGATAVDLVDVRTEARPWVRAPSGERVPVRGDVLPTAPARLLRRPLFVPVGTFGGGLDFTLDVPRGAVLQADVGMGELTTSVGPLRQTAGLRLSFLLVTADGQETLRAIDLPRDPDGARRWEPVELDLSAFADRRATLRIVAEPTTPLPQPTVAWLGSPRIALSSTDR